MPVPHATCTMNEPEAKVEDIVLQEEKTSSEHTKAVPLRSKTLNTYASALKELMAFFSTAKYAYVALYSTREGSMHNLFHYRLDRAEIQAQQLLQLLRPKFLSKISEQSVRIDMLKQYIKEVTEHLMDDPYTDMAHTNAN